MGGHRRRNYIHFMVTDLVCPSAAKFDSSNSSRPRGGGRGRTRLAWSPHGHARQGAPARCRRPRGPVPSRSPLRAAASPLSPAARSGRPGPLRGRCVLPMAIAAVADGRPWWLPGGCVGGGRRRSPPPPPLHSARPPRDRRHQRYAALPRALVATPVGEVAAAPCLARRPSLGEVACARAHAPGRTKGAGLTTAAAVAAPYCAAPALFFFFSPVLLPSFFCAPAPPCPPPPPPSTRAHARVLPWAGQRGGWRAEP